jgi:hypothetical protein
MDADLVNRFFQKKLQDLLTDSTKPFPTIICERENLQIIELVRLNVLYAVKYGKFIPFTHEHIRPGMQEGLDKTKGNTNWGDLYIIVNIN